jgi:lipopolysaccharide transport system ATP-binding protein
MKRWQVKAKLDKIIAFSEIEQFIDTPVKRYSSGMYVRLAFSVAAHLDSDIMLADEVLAVGDAAFQKKAMGKMSDLSADTGKTVIFVSHNMAAVRTLCNKGIVLERGRLSFQGEIDDASIFYLNNLTSDSLLNKDLGSIERIQRHCTGEARIKGFSLENEKNPGEFINADEPSVAVIDFDVLYDDVRVGAEFMIMDDFQKVALLHSYQRSGICRKYNRGRHRLVCRIKSLPLVSGRYSITIALSRPGVPIDCLENASVIDVVLPYKSGMMTEFTKNSGNGCVYVDHEWFEQ